MTVMLEVRALDFIDEWQRTGQIRPAQDSIKTRIEMAALAGEIDNAQKVVLNSMVPELVFVTASLELASQVKAVRTIQAKIQSKADVNPADLDIVEQCLNNLYDVITKSDDEKMIMIHKMLYDFVNNLRKDVQRSQGGEQKDYSHENAQDGGQKIDDNKQAPSEMNQGGGMGDHA